MGKQRVVNKSAEVGGSLAAEYLQQLPPARPGRRNSDDDAWMWRDLYGAPASGTSPEAAAERERRRYADAPALGEPVVGQALGLEPRPVVDVTLPAEQQ